MAILVIDILLLVVYILLFFIDILLLVVDSLLLIVDALLQRSLARTLDMVEIDSLTHEPDTQLSHHECSQPDRQVYPRSRYYWRILRPLLVPPVHVRQTWRLSLESMDLQFQYLPPLSLLGIAL